MPWNLKEQGCRMLYWLLLIGILGISDSTLVLRLFKAGILDLGLRM